MEAGQAYRFTSLDAPVARRRGQRDAGDVHSARTTPSMVDAEHRVALCPLLAKLPARSRRSCTCASSRASPSPRSPTRSASARCTCPACWPGASPSCARTPPDVGTGPERAGPAAGERVGVVGDRPDARRHRQGAGRRPRRRGRRDQSGAGHATRLAQGAAADGVDVRRRARRRRHLNEAANGLAGTACALGVLPGGSTNVFARTIGMVNDPIEATGQLLAALAAQARRAGRPRDGQRPLLPVPRRHGVRRRRRRAGREAVGAQALRRPPAVRLRRGRHVVPPLRPEAARLRACRSTDGADVDDGFFAICLNTNPYTYLGNRPLDIAPDAGLDRRLVARQRPHDVVRAAAVDHRLGAAARHPAAAPAARSAYTVGIDGRDGAGDRRHGPSPTRSTATTSARSTSLEFRHEPDCLDLVLPVAPACRRHARWRWRGDVGDVGDDRVDAARRRASGCGRGRRPSRC